MNTDKLVKLIVSQRIIKNSFKKFVMAKTKDQELHLNNNEMMTVYYLRAFPGLTQKEMSLYLDYDLATAGRILESLAKKGVITRVKSKQDARRNDIALTDRGNEVLDNLFKFVTEWYQQNAEGLFKDDLREGKGIDLTIKLAEQLTKNWGGTNGWK